MNAIARFTAIIVNYNGGDLLVDCVRSLQDAGLPLGQIVVVDNGSRDVSIDTLQQQLPGCRLLRMGCNAGFAKAVNHGLAHTDTEFAVLVNNDAQLDAQALIALAQAFDAHQQAAFLGGRLLNQDGSLQNAIAPFPRLSTELLPRPLQKLLWPRRADGRYAGDLDIQVESVIGALFSVRMNALREIGALDEAFFFFLEETEWCHRAWRKGWQVWHIPAARAVHRQGATAKKFNALARIEYHRSRLIYFKKTAPASYPLVLAITWLKAILNAASNALALIITLGLSNKLRQKSQVYGHILGWYLSGRPAHVGLPDKCPAPDTSSSEPA
jgi:N-acetylglucosaminyl-diphospho-decaprenol L-rhamnosyltransferase